MNDELRELQNYTEESITWLQQLFIPFLLESFNSAKDKGLDYEQLRVLKMVWIHRVNQLDYLAEKLKDNMPKIEGSNEQGVEVALQRVGNLVNLLLNELPEKSQAVRIGF